VLNAATKESVTTAAQSLSETHVGASRPPDHAAIGAAARLTAASHQQIRRGYDDLVVAGLLTAKDPILFAGSGPNLYAYVLNDPINAFDATGLIANADAVEAFNTLSLALGLARISLPRAAPILRAVILTALPWLSWEAYVHYAKGERSWEKARGDDPFWEKSVQELQLIEQTTDDPNVRERAKRIRKQKQKKGSD
jgi:hypothetical protein